MAVQKYVFIISQKLRTIIIQIYSVFMYFEKNVIHITVEAIVIRAQSNLSFNYYVPCKLTIVCEFVLLHIIKNTRNIIIMCLFVHSKNV